MDMSLENSAVPVDGSMPPPIQSESIPGTRLFIKHLNFNTTREDLEDLFSPIGPLADVRVMNGVAFVEYQSIEDAKQAVEKLNGTQLKEFEIGVDFHREHGAELERVPRGTYRIKVKNLPPNAQWQELKDMARDVAQVTANYTDVSEPGAGVIEVHSKADMEKGIAALNGHDYQGSVLEAFEDTTPFVVRRGGYRGGRGGYRGGRGGYPRGGRGGYSRGGGDFRGGEFRGGYPRGGYRESFRGGYSRGGGDFRGGEFRGGYPRGGYRESFRGGYSRSGGDFRGGDFRGGYPRGGGDFRGGEFRGGNPQYDDYRSQRDSFPPEREPAPPRPEQNW